MAREAAHDGALMPACEAIGAVHDAEVNAFVTGEVHHVTALPAEWDGGCLPFGDHGEETIAQILTRSR